MKKTSAIFLAIGALVVGVAGGYFWGYAGGVVAPLTPYASKGGAVNNFTPSAPTSTLSLSGKVKSINGSVITMDAISPTPNSALAAAGFLVSREVTVTSATKITREVPTSPTVFQQEMQAYTKRASSTSTSTDPGTLPSPLTETSISLSDIKVNDMIFVTASSNIMGAASFTATVVQVQPKIL
jgi:hypothetical protein